MVLGIVGVCGTPFLLHRKDGTPPVGDGAPDAVGAPGAPNGPSGRGDPTPVG
jgi:hypothetical protein